MEVNRYIKSICLELIYTIATIIFLIKLADLNKILIEESTKNVFEFLAYGDGRPLWYFVYTLIIVVIGIGLSIHNFHSIRYTELDFAEIIMVIVKLMVIIILIILLIIFINNPILRAIITAGCKIMAGGYLATQG